MSPEGGDTALAEYLQLGGFLATEQIQLGYFGTEGTFVQSNGVHANSDFIRLWGFDRTMNHHVTGSYTLIGGLFTCPEILVTGGGFTQNGGTNLTPDLSITDIGSYYIDGGFLSASNVAVSSSDFRGFYSSFYHQGGTTTVQETFSLGRAGSFTIQLGTFSAPNISIGAGATDLQARYRPIFAMQGSGAIV